MPPADFAARLRGFGPLGIAAVLVVLSGLLILPAVSAGLILLWAWASRTPLRDLGFRGSRSWTRTIVSGVALGAAFKLVMKALVMPLLGVPAINPVYHYLEGNARALPPMIAIILFSAGFGEELLFRGYAFERIERLLGRGRAALAVALVVPTAAFAAIHLPDQRLPGVEQAAIVGLAFAALYAWRRRIGLVMIAHAAFDLTAVALIYAGWEARVAHLLFR